MPAGQWLVGAAGIVVAGVWMGAQAVRRKYRDKLKLDGSPAPGLTGARRGTRS